VPACKSILGLLSDWDAGRGDAARRHADEEDPSSVNYIPWKDTSTRNSVDEYILYDDMQFTRRDAGRKLGRASGP